MRGSTAFETSLAKSSSIYSLNISLTALAMRNISSINTNLVKGGEGSMICCMYMILISLLFGIFVRFFLLNLHLFKEVHIWFFSFPSSHISLESLTQTKPNLYLCANYQNNIRFRSHVSWNYFIEYENNE